VQAQEEKRKTEEDLSKESNPHAKRILDACDKLFCCCCSRTARSIMVTSLPICGWKASCRRVASRNPRAN